MKRSAYITVEVDLDDDNELNDHDDALLALATGQYTVVEVDIP